MDGRRQMPPPAARRTDQKHATAAVGRQLDLSPGQQHGRTCARYPVGPISPRRLLPKTADRIVQLDALLFLAG